VPQFAASSSRQLRPARTAHHCRPPPCTATLPIPPSILLVEGALAPRRPSVRDKAHLSPANPTQTWARSPCRPGSSRAWPRRLLFSTFGQRPYSAVKRTWRAKPALRAPPQTTRPAAQDQPTCRHFAKWRDSESNRGHHDFQGPDDGGVEPKKPCKSACLTVSHRARCASIPVVFGGCRWVMDVGGPPRPLYGRRVGPLWPPRSPRGASSPCAHSRGPASSGLSRTLGSEIHGSSARGSLTGAFLPVSSLAHISGW
jgi:hypothetical protein